MTIFVLGFCLQFQGQNEKELRQIFDGQNTIHQVLRDMGRKVDELMGRQEMVISRLNSMPQTGGQQQPQVGSQVSVEFGVISHCRFRFVIL